MLEEEILIASLEGRVVELYSRRGISGVLVSVGGRSVVTDANGLFRIEFSPSRSVSVTAQHRDFEGYSEALNLSENVAYSIDDILLRQTRVRAL